MDILIVCNGLLPSAAETIQNRFGGESIPSDQLLRKVPGNFDYVVVVDDIEAIRVSRKNTGVSTCTIALVRNGAGFTAARMAGASAVFSHGGYAAAHYIRDRDVPPMSRSASDMKQPIRAKA